MGEVNKIGKYEILSTLGQGAMGVVYKAFDPHIERTVALKTIRKDVLVPDELEPLLTRFKQEAQAAGRLTHPGIVTVYEYGEDEGTVFIAMEFVQGRELKEILDNNQRLPLSTSVNLIIQLLDALAYSHDSGVVHRDIKPGNIFVLKDGRIKVTDFGIAKIESSNLTQCGDFFGTPSCMSPEQFTGQPVDRRSDLFSVGVILYQLLAGEKPFPGTSLATIMHRVLNTVPPDISGVNSLVPASFDQVLNMALAKNASERFQTASEFTIALKNAFQGGADSNGTVVMEETLSSCAIDVDATIIQSSPAVASITAPSKAPVDPLAEPSQAPESNDFPRSDSPGPIPKGNSPGRRLLPIILIVIVLSVGAIVTWRINANKPVATLSQPLVVEKQDDTVPSLPNKNLKNPLANEPRSEGATSPTGPSVNAPDKATATKVVVGTTAPSRRTPKAGEPVPNADWP